MALKQQLDKKLTQLEDRVYPAITPDERFKLTMEAEARGDEEERKRLVKSCPKKDYRMNDAAFTNRIDAAEALTTAFVIDIAGLHGKLQMVKAFAGFLPHLMDVTEQVAVTNMYDCYKEGWQQGFKEAGGKGKVSKKRAPSLDKVLAKMDGKRERYFRLLAGPEGDLQLQLQSTWDAFGQVCREDLGVEPGDLLNTFYSPALEWLEDDLTDDVVALEDMKVEVVKAMKDYWCKAVGEG